MKMYDFADAGKTNPIKPNQTQLQRQKNAEFKVPPLFQKNTGQDFSF